MAGGINLTTPYGFSKITSSKKRVKLWLFVSFDIILTLMRLGFLKVAFPGVGWGVQFDTFFIFQEELIQFQ